MGPVRTCDIFCGAGGSSLGARRAGAQIVAGIDHDQRAADTFQHNFPDARVLTTDLEDLSHHDLRRQVGRVDLLLASPECQHHSMARGARPRDEASKDTAFLVTKCLEALLPRWVVVENVPEMRVWNRYQELLDRLDHLNYRMVEMVLDASHYGVPQRRRRLFLVGGQGEWPMGQPQRHHPVPVAESCLDPPGTWRTRPLSGLKPNTLVRICRGWEVLGKDKPFLVMYYGLKVDPGWSRLDAPLRTVVTRDRFGLVTPTPEGHTYRMLQVPELTRAMGFGEEFSFPSELPREARLRQLGNAVCPPVMERIVKMLMEAR